MPFTTGILIGIGETPAERAQSLIAIRDIHERHGHIQEVIIQNFRAKPEIAMADAPEPDAIEMARAIATARLVLGAEDERAGAAEPLAQRDRTVPRAPGSTTGAASRRSARTTSIPRRRGRISIGWPNAVRGPAFDLRERLAIYPEYVDDDWVDPRCCAAALAWHAAEVDGGVS